jgi:hypothetical protein
MIRGSLRMGFAMCCLVATTALAQEKGRVPSTVEGVGVEVVGPNRITKGVPAEYKILLKNRRDQLVSRLVVEVELSETFSVQKTEPMGETIPGRIAWRVPVLAGKETQTLRFEALAQAGGSGRVQAFVREQPADDQAKPISQIQPPDLPSAEGDAPPAEEPAPLPSTPASEPTPEILPPAEPKGSALIEIDAPQEVARGVPFICELKLTNNGSVPLSGMSFDMNLTEGLRVLRKLDAEPAKLPSEPGASVTTRVEMVSDGEAIQAIRAKFSAQPNVAVQLEREIRVATSPFDLKLELPREQVMGQPLKFRLYIANNRPEPAESVQVFAVIPEGIDVVSGEAGALYNRRTRTVRWQAGTLEPQEERGFRLTVKPTQAGEFRFSARAEGGAGSLRDEALGMVKVQGYAALGVSFEPSVDVATENQEVTLTFDVRSRGSSLAEGVVFRVEVPAGVELVASASPGWKEEGGAWQKPAAGPIPPGGQLQEKIVVRATKAGAISLKGIVTGEGDVGEMIRVQPLRVIGALPVPPTDASSNASPNGT